MELTPYLRLMVQRRGSDLYFSTGACPHIKISGRRSRSARRRWPRARPMQAGLHDHERRAGTRVREHPGVQPGDLGQHPRPLPRQRLPPARRHGDGDPLHPGADPEHRGAAPAAAAEEDHHREARPGPGGRFDRLGQVDDAGLDDRLPQPADDRAHPHDRGPDRVPAPAQEVEWSTSARSASTR
jgi:hypothetical protein